MWLKSSKEQQEDLGGVWGWPKGVQEGFLGTRVLEQNRIASLLQRHLEFVAAVARAGCEGTGAPHMWSQGSSLGVLPVWPFFT